jgi:glycosyltransferase involved in cell wall biosynthesis
MSRGRVVLSVNASWNIVNFRKELIRALQTNGFEVVALAPEDEHTPRLAGLDVPFQPIRIDSQGLSPFNDIRLIAAYGSALRQIRPVLFLGYTIKPNIYGSLAAQWLRIPVINNVSGLGTAFIRGGLLGQIVTTLYRIAFRRSATVFFQNTEDLALFRARKIVRAEQARLLPGSGIDLDHFRPQPKPDGGPFTFLFVGRLLWDKGLAEFVEAARRVRARHPEVRFQMLGFVDAPNRTAVARSDVEAWQSEGLIEYLSPCDDVRPHVAAADCVVLPSYREGLPRTLLEGAAMAKPLIATDVAGCRSIVEPGVNGLLCTVRDAESLAGAMEEMLAMTPDERTAMGERGRARIEAEFGQQIVIDRYLDAIDAALAQSAVR